jgi:polysaccharide deacetylase family protein (PEP-CTERM system associated)
MYNVFSVDLEDWCFTDEHHDSTDIKLITACKSDLWKNTSDLLELLMENNIKATFFVLGKLAESEPELVRNIAQQGHEIACHGFNHKSIKEMTPDDFRKDIELSINAIKNACGIIPRGYRAANFSIVKETMWAIDILKEFDFQYDSSIQPIKIHPGYGIGDIEMRPFKFESGIIEIPLSCAEVLKMRIPCSGGAYFRFYPYIIFNYLFRKCNKQERPGIFYIHPWELSNSYSEASGIKKFRKYYNNHKTIEKLERLVNDFKFVTMRDLIREMNLGC